MQTIIKAIAILNTNWSELALEWYFLLNLEGWEKEKMKMKAIFLQNVLLYCGFLKENWPSKTQGGLGGISIPIFQM